MLEISLCKSLTEIANLQMCTNSALPVHRECIEEQKILPMKKNSKIAKGYRLSPQTHKKISKIRKLLNSDSEKALSTICDYFLNLHVEAKDKEKNILISN